MILTELVVCLVLVFGLGEGGGGGINEPLNNMYYNNHTV